MVVVHVRPVRLRRRPEVGAARVKHREGARVLPDAEDPEGAVRRDLGDLRRVARGVRVVEAVQFLVEVVDGVVAAAAIEHAQVAPVRRVARQLDAALKFDHALRDSRVDAAGHVPVARRRAPELAERVLVVGVEAALEGPEDFLADLRVARHPGAVGEGGDRRHRERARAGNCVGVVVVRELVAARGLRGDGAVEERDVEQAAPPFVPRHGSPSY